MIKMTIDKLADQYLLKLKENPSNERVDLLSEEIRNLTYSDTGKRISLNDKLTIVQKMKDKCNNKKLLEHTDNSALLYLINLLEDKIGE